MEDILLMQVKAKIQEKLLAALDIHCLEVVNESSAHQGSEEAETHFRILVVSKDFEGLSQVNRQRKVYQALADLMQNPIHALSQQTFTIEEWQADSIALSSSPPCHKRAKS